MKISLTAIALVALCAPAFGQSSNSESNSQAGSQSSIYQEASTIPRQSPSMGAPGMMHTAPCMVSIPAAASGPGFGISFGAVRMDDGCDTRAGAAALASLIGPEAAIEHLCLDPKMRSTLEPMGRCNIHRSATLYLTCQNSGADPHFSIPVNRLRDDAYIQAAAGQCFGTR